MRAGYEKLRSNEYWPNSTFILFGGVWEWGGGGGGGGGKGDSRGTSP